MPLTARGKWLHMAEIDLGSTLGHKICETRRWTHVNEYSQPIPTSECRKGLQNWPSAPSTADATHPQDISSLPVTSLDQYQFTDYHLEYSSYSHVYERHKRLSNQILTKGSSPSAFRPCLAANQMRPEKKNTTALNLSTFLRLASNTRQLTHNASSRGNLVRFVLLN